MDLYRLRFDDPEGWESTAPGVRFKRRANGAAGLRLVEMLSSASHSDWCTVGHSGCVLEGTLEMEFDNEFVRFEPGDGMVIPLGEAHRHRPRAITDRVRVAVVDHPQVRATRPIPPLSGRPCSIRRPDSPGSWRGFHPPFGTGRTNLFAQT